MLIGGRHYRSIWLDRDTGLPKIIDQTELPHRLSIQTIPDVRWAANAISCMQVRGAPLIGATAAHGLALALSADPSDASLETAARMLIATRPTAINLHWAVDRVWAIACSSDCGQRAERARVEAEAICDEDVASCSSIGTFGLELLRGLAADRAASGRPVTATAPLNLLTHCNAGWLATVDWGTALAPIYKAHEVGLPVHVWVDETRPRNQGASLTAFELREMGVPHTVIVDSAGGHLMQRGQVDAVIVGSDRTTSTGDVCNKVGTYLKALAARDNGIPFFVALPLSTIDWSISDGLSEIPIEERDGEEVRTMSGLTADGKVERIELFDELSSTANPAFDVTPSSLVTSLITDHGVVDANSNSLKELKPIAKSFEAARVERG